MTNRERAIAIWRRQGGLGDDFRPEDWPEEIDPLVADLDAAERRGWIAALEWALSSHGWPHTMAMRDKLFELKAEENKR